MNEDLKRIKKKYGEDMMHLCRSLFPTILEKEGLLSKLIEDNFAPSRSLYQDLVDNYLEEDFKNYIFSFLDVEKKVIETVKKPKELLSEAGYDLYECTNEEQIQSFKNYYAPGEELCTFRGNRLDRCHVFFAVKKNVDEIKRENFTRPRRQDEYGTSVISIQFSRGGTNTLSIKNRYNHSVNNPDSTFGNNLENIIPGLTNSFEKEYNLNINSNSANNLELPNYVRASDGKLYKYNYEVDNIYYGPDNIVIDNFNPKKLDNSKLVIDYYIIDLHDLTIGSRWPDGFNRDKDIISKIEIVKKEEGNRLIKIYDAYNEQPEEVTIDKNNRIINYKNNNIEMIRPDFLVYNKTLRSFEAENVKTIGDRFLRNGGELVELNLENVIEMGDDCLMYNRTIERINLPNVKKLGKNLLRNNKIVEVIDFPNVEEIGSNFMYCNEEAKIIKLDNLKTLDDGFLFWDRKLEELYMPKVEKIGYPFASSSKYKRDDFLKEDDKNEEIKNSRNK